MIAPPGWIAVVTLVCALAPSAATSFFPQYGPHGVGVRILPAEVPVGGRPGQVTVWYPAPRCAAPLTFRDYVTWANGQTRGDASLDLRRGWESEFGPVADEAWDRVLAAPLTGCKDAERANGKFPVILGIDRPGAWPVTAELLASHGYVVALIARRPAPPAADIVDTIANQYRSFKEDLGLVLGMVSKDAQVDPRRVGLIGQNHVLLLFAMDHPDVRAIALQDSGFRPGRDAEAMLRAGDWRPERLQAALFHAVPRDQLSEEARWPALVEAMKGPWLRLIIETPHLGHADTSADGYLARMRLPYLTPPHDRLRDMFVGVADAELAFFDACLSGKGRCPAPASVDRALFTIEKK